jgi:hypothetical protein
MFCAAIAGLVFLAPATAAIAALATGLSAIVCAGAAVTMTLDGIASWAVLVRGGPHRRPRIRDCD